MQAIIIMRDQANPEGSPIFYSEPFPTQEAAEASLREIELIFPIDYEMWMVPLDKVGPCPSCKRMTYVDEDSENLVRHVHDDLPITYGHLAV